MKSIYTHIKRRLSIDHPSSQPISFPKTNPQELSLEHPSRQESKESNKEINLTPSPPDQEIQTSALSSHQTLMSIEEVDEPLPSHLKSPPSLSTSLLDHQANQHQTLKSEHQALVDDQSGSGLAHPTDSQNQLNFNQKLDPQHPSQTQVSSLHPNLLPDFHSKANTVDSITLKPVVNEKVYHHVIEDIQKVRMHERHITHIQHHIQPITQSGRFVHESNTYNLGSLNPESPSEVISLSQASIDEIIRKHLSRYQASHPVQHLCPPHQTVHRPDLEQQTTILHHYDIIQPVLIQPDPLYRFGFCAEEGPTGLVEEDTDQSKLGSDEVYKLKATILKLKEENQELRSLLNLKVQDQSLLNHLNSN